MNRGAGEAPLFAGKIHGVRGWNFTRGRLSAAATERGWATRGKATRARCNRTRTHRSPVPDCGCGLYATHPWNAGPIGEVVGVVEAWGRVELHRSGFRAQYARPVVLFAFSDSTTLEESRDARRAAEVHGCEVVELGSATEVSAYCASRGWGLSREVVRKLVPKDSEPDVRTRSRLRSPPDPWPSRVAEWLGTALAVVIGVPMLLLMWAAWATFIAGAALGMLYVVTGWNPLGIDLDAEAAPGLAPAKQVRIADEWVLPAGERIPATYVARLVNRGDASAVWARPSLRVSVDGERRRISRREFAWPAIVPAHGEALVVQPLHGAGGPDVRAGPIAARQTDRPPASPVRVDARLVATGDHGCKLVARIDAALALERLRVWILPLDRSGAPSTLLLRATGPVPKGASTQVLERAKRCPGDLPEIRAYPALGSGQLIDAKE